MKRNAIIILVLALVVGCTALGLQVKSYSEMTPKERITVLFKVYNSQYSDYKVMAASTTLTDVQKNVLRQKKKVLIEVYPVIQGLDMMVVEGKPLDSALEAKAISLLNQLGAAITK